MKICSQLYAIFPERKWKQNMFYSIRNREGERREIEKKTLGSWLCKQLSHSNNKCKKTSNRLHEYLTLQVNFEIKANLNTGESFIVHTAR